ncbi:uncharacterized protein LOC133879311 [Alnus glutinosa]|uniref:uncharacterized protein LOC133879311 n=1 Tax=Alnus glutinosa TaxID=3517 RepID=UPI002D771C55|nr:uncharacterized protein LOC133879311 [Alnus glutinosa]
MGLKRYLPMDHPWRRNKRAFDGTQERECESNMQSGDDILGQLEGMVFGNESAGKTKEKKRNRGQSIETATDDVVWKKRSVFFWLSYWKDNLLQHNLDVMHIEKNVMDNIFGTILDIKGKTKNDLAAHQDLQEMGLRPKLHSFTGDDGKTYMPVACHTMSNEEKTNFLKVIRNLRVPNGYAPNVSRCVCLKERTISGLKSHDSHIIMQPLLPFALHWSLPDNVVRPLIVMFAFFRGICSTNLTQEDMDRLEGDICVTLCKMVQIFLPGFFTSKVHLVVHLVHECRLGGPIQYRWMHPVERSLGVFKSSVRNKAALEGCIEEGYIAIELVTFYSKYLENAPTFHNRPQQNPDGPKGVGTLVSLNRTQLSQIHRYISFNSDEFNQLRTMHMDMLRRSCDRRRTTDDQLEAQHHRQFFNWSINWTINVERR